MKKVLVAVLGLAVLAGCQAQTIKFDKPGGETVEVLTYPGGSYADDLMIVNGVNYFGKIGFDMNDALTDLSWRGNNGTKVQAECVETGKADYTDEIECVMYEVYRSTFDLIPSGTTFRAPKRF